MQKDNNLKSKAFVGTVVSVKMQGTAVVKVDREIVHPIYKKVLKRNKKLKVDTNKNELSLGDKVRIVETRPISKGKFFKVDKKI